LNSMGKFLKITSYIYVFEFSFFFWNSESIVSDSEIFLKT
jgi:hypothetical protein